MKLTKPLRTLGGPIIPEGNDNPPTLLPTISPIVEFPGVLSSVFGAAAQPITRQEESFTSFYGKIQAPSAAQDQVNFATFAAGLWRIIVNWSFAADYASIGSNTGAIRLLNPQGAICPLVNLVPVIGSQSGSFSLLLNLSQHDWVLQLSTPATAAAQNSQSAASVTATRVG